MPARARLDLDQISNAATPERQRLDHNPHHSGLRRDSDDIALVGRNWLRLVRPGGFGTSLRSEGAAIQLHPGPDPDRKASISVELNSPFPDPRSVPREMEIAGRKRNLAVRDRQPHVVQNFDGNRRSGSAPLNLAAYGVLQFFLAQSARSPDDADILSRMDWGAVPQAESRQTRAMQPACRARQRRVADLD